jgi:hypothetical protein
MLTPLQPGVYTVGPGAVDQLLALQRYPDLRLLVLREPFERVSDAHVLALREWVESGGVAWLEAPGVAEEDALQLLVSARVDDFDFRKTSTGGRGGELIVRGMSERLRIHDHPLTEDVDELYVYPRYRFDGTPRAEPILEMTDTRGTHGIVIAAVPLGDGLVVLDGTARERRKVFGRISGFEEDNPNAVRDGDRWNSYDWSRLIDNAQRLAERDEEAAVR